jgi:small subunit ribosomal protein S2
MERMPKAIFIVDTKKEETAVREANRLGVPIIGLIDTNSNPDLIAYPIPGNDDATKAIRVVAGFLAEAVIEGRKKFLSYLSHEGVAVKEDKIEPLTPELLPEEEVKIKEIEEIIETAEPEGTEAKSAKKDRPKQAPDEKLKLRKKV